MATVTKMISGNWRTEKELLWNWDEIESQHFLSC